MRSTIRNILFQEDDVQSSIIPSLNPIMRLDCASPDTIAFTGNKVTQWSDKTSNGNNATPPAEGNSPDYGLVSLSGHPLVTCNLGSLPIGLSTPLVLTGDYTIILVARQAISPASRVIQSASFNCVLSPSRDINAFYLQAGDYASPAVVPLNTYGITTTVIGTSAPQLWYEGINYGIGSITGDWGQLTIGAVGAFPENANCDIAEIIAFNYRLSPAQVAAVDAELTAKWGI